MTLSASDAHDRATIDVLDSSLTFVDVGSGDPVVFLHGNPTSSYLWRNIIPAVAVDHRCLAPDLLGMGDSGPHPEGNYSFVEHYRYLDAWFHAMDLMDRVTLVVHDWGSGLGFHWANQHRDAVRAIVYMEAIVRPITWDEWPEVARGVFQGMRSPAGEEIVLEKNVFVDRILPSSVIRDLTEEEMTHYRKRFTEPGESRRPTLAWPRQIPIDGEPPEMHAIVSDYSNWLSTSDVPKLYVHAEPGFLSTISEPHVRDWPNQQRVDVPGIHFIQEDAPGEISTAIVDFLRTVP